MVGNSATSNWLSVWPPLSASTVMSSATGTRAANAASVGVIRFLATNAARISAGAGDMNRVATSRREILANTRRLRAMRPSASRCKPATAQRTTAGVSPMNAEAEMMGTFLRINRSATRSSSAASLGE